MEIGAEEFSFGGLGQHSVGICCESCMQKIQSQQQGLMGGERLTGFISGAEVQRILVQCLSDTLVGFFGTTQRVQDADAQMLRLQVTCVPGEGFIDQFIGVVPFLIPAGDACQLETGRTLPGLAPRRFVKGVKSFIEPLLIPQGQAELIIGLPIAGVGVAHGQSLDRFPGQRFCFAEQTAHALESGHGDQAAAVSGVPTQSFLVVVLRTEGGVTVLLQMQAVQIELFVGLHFLRLRSRRGRRGRLRLFFGRNAEG